MIKKFSPKRRKMEKIYTIFFDQVVFPSPTDFYTFLRLKVFLEAFKESNDQCIQKTYLPDIEIEIRFSGEFCIGSEKKFCQGKSLDRLLRIFFLMEVFFIESNFWSTFLWKNYYFYELSVMKLKFNRFTSLTYQTNHPSLKKLQL